MNVRTVEDRLREEYFDLLPEIRRVTEHLEAVIKYRLLPISRGLDRFEQITVKSRIKDCESAVDALKRRQEGATFDRDKSYVLKNLRDLAGVRVLAFPRSRLHEIDAALREEEEFKDWKEDPVLGEKQEKLAFKYSGHSLASKHVVGEYQIVSTLIGLFWEVEHSAIYKPSPQLRGVVRSREMKEPIQNVLSALRSFEEKFEELVQQGRS
jgi:ppGpp synthetase/RelA/SpoT-type nucleotidyltranferase